MTQDFGVNQALVEEMFIRWAANPSAVAPAWQRYFDSLPQTDWPQLTSAGSIVAPTIAAESNGVGSNGLGSDGIGSDGAGGNSQMHLDGTHIPSAPLPPVVNTEDTPPDGLLMPVTAEELPAAMRRSKSFPPSSDLLNATELQGRVSALVNAYRVRGHLFADLDPLGIRQKPLDNEFMLERYGLGDVDPNTTFSTGDLAAPSSASLQDIIDRLSETYARTIGAEFTFLEDREARTWLQHQMESTCNRLELSREKQIRILTKLTDAEIFEQFLHTKYIGAKRFSLEGGESLIPLLDLMVEDSARHGVQEMVLGMAHRGRLNVMVNIMEMDVRDIFAGFEDDKPEKMLGGGDVKYHLGYSVDRQTESGNVHMTLTFNPSHLEFVNPVVEGRARAKQDRRKDERRDEVLPILIHGDAAFVGQGIVAETLNLSELQAYHTGGTIHVVVNNQIGFTTIPEDSRSTRYCTDITRMLRCPVFHVNGEDPEAVAQVVRLAVEYRQRFHRDVVIDLFCYRKYGHNEGDEPRFTQPLMYAAVDQKQTIRQVYTDLLVKTGKITDAQAEEIETRRKQDLEDALDEARKGNGSLVPSSMGGLWKDYLAGTDANAPDVDTGVKREILESLLDKLTTTPEWFTPHPRIKRFVLDKQRKALDGADIDWGTAENLAFASLLTEGVRCRLTGQDVRRGTFSHRHAVIYDVNTGRRHTRLGHLSEDQAGLEIYDSPLSEAGVLGFEWGYSLDSPDALVAWEAQFGDFVNGAQVIIDQFLTSSEDKWHRLSALVMLLPHGFEGQGPEHSSARIERFLNLCAEDNIQVINPTTPAQIFHALRRQVVRKWRKPLVVMTPKSLLRHRKAVSTLDDLAQGTFKRIIDDTSLNTKEAKKVRRVIFCSGKVYYDLLEQRDKEEKKDIAIVRLEQLYPLSADEVSAVLSRYPKKAELLWVQEEPWNMGAWFFINARLSQMTGRVVRCLSRDESASPATGSKAAHNLEQNDLLRSAME